MNTEDNAMNSEFPRLSSQDSDPVMVMLRDTSRTDRVLERPRSWWRRPAVLATLAALVVLGALVWLLVHFAGARNSVERSRLTIATVERGLFVRDVTADGQVVAAGSPTLYAAAAGTVTLKVHAGDAVTKGQILASLDSPDLTAKLAQEQATLQSLRIDWQRAQLDAQSKLAQLQAAYEQAQVDQKTAQRELERSQKAYELGSYSQLQMLRAQDGLEKAQFAYQQAKTNYESQPAQNRFDIDSKKTALDRQQYVVTDLQRQVNALQVSSPVGGRVGQVEISDRANVAKDASLLTVTDLSSLEVAIKVPESEARDLATGMGATLQGAGGEWKGNVSGVSPEVVDGEVVARVRFADPQPQGLRQNQRIGVRILLDRRDDVLAVMRGSFVEQGGGMAYVVHGDIAERQPVRLGAQSTDKVEILDGLQPGDQVVVSGVDAFNGADRVILTR